ncbi:hypothetical protein PISMIDRAFT_680312 [Pisolithus microcarpus 441]|uniref:Uncharacterized protein n=1 Tax=Pisolithus microcarpus 441 TaxID=765257 RepID=A0A0C9Z8D0_9AGAM|nr:hypothetical protein PISMIDRAFT_680312 [Pisolithus microcarpus 441]
MLVHWRRRWQIQLIHHGYHTRHKLERRVRIVVYADRNCAQPWITVARNDVVFPANVYACTWKSSSRNHAVSIDRDLNMCPSVPLPSRHHQDGHYVETSPMLTTSENRRL